MRHASFYLLFTPIFALASCPAPGTATAPTPTPLSTPAPAPAPPPEPAPPPPRTVVISLVGTADLHGHVEQLPWLAGYLANLRQARARDGGVALLDAGDLFQGTLESNLGEGAAVIRAYNALGYQAAAVGNHEFDFGPVGPAATPKSKADDARGALKARAQEAKFPLLMANVVDAATGARADWPNMPARTVFAVAGVRVGVVGVTTEQTPYTTIAANFDGLMLAPLALTIAAEAAALREAGAQVVLVAAHAGARCKHLDDARNLASCDDGEIMAVARALPPGIVDAIVAGHTHGAVAHEVAGIPVIESWANGRAFGRIDFVVDLADRPAAGRILGRTIHPPRELCAARSQPCQAGDYEGRPVAADDAIARLVAPDVERARSRREEKLGVTVAGLVKRSYDEESPLGNLAADLMRAARPRADVALTNGGGLRADLPPGELTYGQLYETFPFDNRFAVLTVTGADLQRLFARHLRGDAGILSMSGIRVAVTCAGGEAVVEIRRDDGKLVGARQKLTVVTSDFLATGGDGFAADLGLAPGALLVEDDPPLRDAMAEVLRKRRGRIAGDDKRLFDPARRRFQYPGTRPVRCDAPAPAPQP